MNIVGLKRLLAPRTLALFGSTWADAVEAASHVVGFTGTIWRVHPTRASTPSVRYFRSVDELPAAPDASFIAAPAHEVPAIARALSQRGAGGFVCFAAGFAETATPAGLELTEELIAESADVPFFGPNCYGFINFFDRTALWPDQVVGGAGKSGVAIICQSGTIALNLLYNQRSLPIGYVLTVGNQTCLAVEDMIELLCADERVTAFGLYVEGVKDPARFARAVDIARLAGKPVALIKAGRTEAAARTARTHTGSLAGADAVFDSYCRQAGVARCDSLATLCETLKVFHAGGPLKGRRVLVMGASGGDMAMTADASRDLGLRFEPIPAPAAAELHAILTDKVTIANPFDFHTHIWFDLPRMRAMFHAAQRSGFDAIGFMIDCPPGAQADPTAYVAAIDEFIGSFPGLPARAALISSLPESMAAATREKCLAAGIIPLQGQREALEALDLAGAAGAAWSQDCTVQLLFPRRNPGETSTRTLSEADGKSALAKFGVTVPRSRVVATTEVLAATAQIGFPVAIKAHGSHLEHKSDVGGVIVNVRSNVEAEAAARRLAVLSETLLVEEMVGDGVAEILVGMTLDAQFGHVLVLGAGGVLTELFRDSVTVLPPFSAARIERALRQLKVSQLLDGYRGKPAGDVASLVDTILACTTFTAAHVDTLVELDINPVIVRPRGHGAVAVDALIRLAEEH